MRKLPKTPPEYLFKIRRWNILDRIAWLIICHYLNTDRYTFRRMHIGPRILGSNTTRKENSKGWRAYLVVKDSAKRKDQWRSECISWEYRRREQARRARMDEKVTDFASMGPRS